MNVFFFSNQQVCTYIHSQLSPSHANVLAVQVHEILLLICVLQIFLIVS